MKSKTGLYKPRTNQDQLKAKVKSKSTPSQDEHKTENNKPFLKPSLYCN